MKDRQDLDALVRGLGLPFTPAELQLADALEAYEAVKFGLFYKVGVGKTFVSTLVMLLHDLPHNLVVMPPILLDQWDDWLRSIGETSIAIFRGPKRTPEMLDAKWVLMSHAIFRDSFTLISQKFAKRQYLLNIDEAQGLKNPKSKLYRHVKTLAGGDIPLLLLTATPTTKPEDTYSYMTLKTPGLYRNFGHWENLHVESRNIFNQITKYANIDVLAKNFAIKSVVRTKKDVYGETLDPIYQMMPYRLSPEHQRLYEKLAEEQLLILSETEKIDATSPQRLRHMMQQIILNYAAFSGRPSDESAALAVLEQTIEEVNPLKLRNSKLSVWTYYRSSTELVNRWLVDRYGEESIAMAYGGSNSQKAVDRIMHDPKCRILLGQPLSVGVGLNLQHVCSEMLFLEMSTVPAHATQAIGRVDRAGQKVRPTIRMAQAIGTVQVKLFRDLLANDDLVSRVEMSVSTLRDEIFGR